MSSRTKRKTTRGHIYKPHEEQTEWQYFEYGMDIDYQARVFRLERDPIIRFICYGLADEALGRGFEIVEKKGETLTDKEKEMYRIIQDNIMMYNDEMVKAA